MLCRRFRWSWSASSLSIYTVLVFALQVALDDAPEIPADPFPVTAQRVVIVLEAFLSRVRTRRDRARREQLYRGGETAQETLPEGIAGNSLDDAAHVLPGHPAKMAREP
jgi:hypothetical protein